MCSEKSNGTVFLNRLAVLINRILLTHRITDGHHHAALDLSFAGQWIDSLAHVMGCNHPVDLTCLLIKNTNLRSITIGHM